MALKIFEEFGTDELLLIDITFLPLKQAAWDYSRGARTERKYCDTDIDKLRIRDVYNYTMSNGNRDVATIQRQMEWYKEDNTIGLIKDVSKEFTTKSLGELNQEIRNGRMTDLTSNASMIAGGDDLVATLYSWYGPEITEYIDRGTLSFETSLKTEIDPARLGLLNTSLAEFGGATIMMLLSFQLIGSYSWT